MNEFEVISEEIVTCVDEYWYEDKECKSVGKWKEEHLIKGKEHYLNNIPKYIYAFKFYDIKKIQVVDKENKMGTRFIYDKTRFNEDSMVYIGKRLKHVNTQSIIDKYGIIHYDVKNAFTIDEYINELKREKPKSKKLERND